MQTRVFIALLLFITVVSLSLVQNYQIQDNIPFKGILLYILTYTVTAYLKHKAEEKGYKIKFLPKKRKPPEIKPPEN